MQHISPDTNIPSRDNLIQSHLAYQTPPYEVSLDNVIKRTPVGRKRSNSLSDLLNKINKLMMICTRDFQKNKITNANIKFLTEVLKRSKSNKLITILSCQYFKKIYQNLNESNINTNELPQFAKCSKRIFLSCLILSHKFINDNTFSMKTWSSISGLNSKDLSTMERWCLSKLDYNLAWDLNKLMDSETDLFEIIQPTRIVVGKRIRDDEIYDMNKKTKIY